ncbi:MAG: hypothetical protein ACD_2C00180G0010 [uncultured bacterium (gcode 4)]|uniref:Uncharacterized protein n=1 Tax=uncultured bacterium (gcode 4) TaxID=1234023 RepID=K2G534_9BACT|nr:MAG: hypothetical protein ACD_2C00180G0010 [uncultured bacterium (gcode 4)]
MFLLMNSILYNIKLDNDKARAHISWIWKWKNNQELTFENLRDRIVKTKDRSEIIRNQF